LANRQLKKPQLSCLDSLSAFPPRTTAARTILQREGTPSPAPAAVRQYHRSGGTAEPLLLAALVAVIDPVLRESTCDVMLVNDHGLPQRVDRILLLTAGGPNARVAAPYTIDFAKAFR
jgi:hypothetical protein